MKSNYLRSLFNTVVKSFSAWLNSFLSMAKFAIRLYMWVTASPFPETWACWRATWRSLSAFIRSPFFLNTQNISHTLTCKNNQSSTWIDKIALFTVAVIGSSSLSSRLNPSIPRIPASITGRCLKFLGSGLPGRLGTFFSPVFSLSLMLAYLLKEYWVEEPKRKTLFITVKRSTYTKG